MRESPLLANDVLDELGGVDFASFLVDEDDSSCSRLPLVMNEDFLETLDAGRRRADTIGRERVVRTYRPQLELRPLKPRARCSRSTWDVWP